jgi:hypothetical protein
MSKLEAAFERVKRFRQTLEPHDRDGIVIVVRGDLSGSITLPKPKALEYVFSNILTDGRNTINGVLNVAEEFVANQYKYLTKLVYDDESENIILDSQPHVAGVVSGTKISIYRLDTTTMELRKVTAQFEQEIRDANLVPNLR